MSIFFVFCGNFYAEILCFSERGERLLPHKLLHIPGNFFGPYYNVIIHVAALCGQSKFVAFGTTDRAKIPANDIFSFLGATAREKSFLWIRNTLGVVFIRLVKKMHNFFPRPPIQLKILIVYLNWHDPDECEKNKATRFVKIGKHKIQFKYFKKGKHQKKIGEKPRK